MISKISNLTIILFLHFAGIIIGLGSVIVIDTLGFISRKSKEWTQITIKAHYVTKPLIWLGTFLILISWVYIYNISIFKILKSILLLIMILNGSFLSFYVSRILKKLDGKKILLPKNLQIKITISFFISLISWWTFVYITVLDIYYLKLYIY